MAIAASLLRSPWLLKPRLTETASLRLFLLPFVGQGPSQFRTWAAKVPSNIDLCPIAIPGRDMRLSAPLAHTSEPLLTDLQTALAPALDKPFVFMGLGTGAMIALALANKLQQMGQAQNLRRVVVVACSSPEQPLPLNIDRMDDARLLDALASLNALPPEAQAQPELTTMLLPIIKADLRLESELRQRLTTCQIVCPITVVTADSDPMTPPNSTDGWAAVSPKVDVMPPIPCDRAYLIRETDSLIKAAVGG